MRDEFTATVRRTSAERVGLRCSNPKCMAPTSGPQLDPQSSVNVGVAAHITAAAPGGPRYDATLTPEQRAAIDNAIWLCQTCSRLVDIDPGRFGVGVLGEWKRLAESHAAAMLGIPLGSGRSDPLAAEAIEILREAAEEGDIWRIKHSAGEWIRAGGKDFDEPTNPGYGAAYVEALEELVARELARSENETWHRLTRSGFKIARSLITSAPTAS